MWTNCAVCMNWHFCRISVILCSLGRHTAAEDMNLPAVRTGQWQWASQVPLFGGYRHAGIVSWKCVYVSMALWLCSMAVVKTCWQSNFARLDCEWESPHYVVWVCWAQLEPALQYSTPLVTRCFGLKNLQIPDWRIVNGILKFAWVC